MELLLPQTHLMVRGSIPQRVSNWERFNMKLNTVLKLLLPQPHTPWSEAAFPNAFSIGNVPT